MKRKHLTLVMFLIAMLLGASSLQAQEKPALLFVNGGWEEGVRKDGPEVRELENAGFIVAVISYTALTRDYAKQFNVLLIPLGYLETKNKEAFFPILHQFLENGGGVFVMDGGAHWKDDLAMNEFLKPLGAEILREMVVETDPNRIYRQKSYYQKYFALTQNIAKLPITEGVQSLWYPITISGGGIQYGELTAILKVDDAWQVVVKGSESSHSAAWPASWRGGFDFPKAPVATYTTSPPLMAIREYKGGRLAVMDFNQTHMTISGRHLIWESIVLEKGDGKVRSDWAKLLSNTYRWLAEPSMKSKSPGGFKPEPQVEIKDEPLPINWVNMELPGRNIADANFYYRFDLKHHYKGLIGIHSDLSDGAGSVEDYVKKAKDMKYAWVVFTEGYERMTEGKWQELITRCKKASSQTFKAIPGLAIKDAVGNHYIMMAADYPWLKPSPSIISDNYYGQPLSFILYDISHNPVPPLMAAWYHGFGIYTYKGNQLIDSSLPDYLDLQRQSYRLWPCSIHLIYSPGEINETLAGTQQTVMMANSLDEIPGMLAGAGGRRMPAPVYVTSGPAIDMCGLLNNWPVGRVGRGMRPDKCRYALDVEGTDRWRYFFSVQDEIPLKEIKVTDDKKTYWRFLPDKKKEFSVSLDGYHDRQKSFVIQAEDEKGRTAVSGVCFPHVAYSWVIMCGDNLNIMDGGSDGALNYFMSKFGGVRQPGGFENYFFQFGPNLMYHRRIVPRMKEFKQYVNPPHQQDVYLAGKDVAIMDDYIRYTYPPDAPVGGGKALHNPKWLLNPTEDYEAVNRIYRFTPTCFMNIFLYETTVTFKKDFILSERRMNPIFRALGNNEFNCGDDSRNLAYHDMDGIMRTNPAKEMEASLPNGGYVAIYPYLTGAAAIFSLQDNLGFRTHLKNNQVGKIDIGIWDNPKEGYKKGEKLTGRYLWVENCGKFGDLLPEDDFEWFQRTMGLSENPAYKVKITQGSVTGTQYILDLKAEGQSFSGLITKTNIPIFLPIRITGLNDNWSAGFWDKTDNRVERIAVKNGVGYCQIDIRERDVDLYIGNLLVCDNPDIRLELVLDRYEPVIEVQNPLSETVKCTIRTPKGFEKYLKFSQEITLAPGSLTKIPLPPIK